MYAYLTNMGMDFIIMYLTVNIYNYDANYMKIVSNIGIILLNYRASKIVIFRKD